MARIESDVIVRYLNDLKRYMLTTEGIKVRESTNEALCDMIMARVQKLADQEATLAEEDEDTREPQTLDVAWKEVMKHIVANDADTSIAAAQKGQGKRPAAAVRVWITLVSEGDRTSHQLCDRLGMLQSSMSARINDLKRVGMVVDSGERRPAREGGNTMATVWHAIRPDDGGE